MLWGTSLGNNQKFDNMNKADPTKKIQFIMEIATDTLEFLDVKFKFDK